MSVTVTSKNIRRAIQAFCGLTFVAFGVALSAKAGLGTTPISSIPYTLSCISQLSLGTYTFIANMTFLLLQILILKREYKVYQLIQIPAIFVFSVLIDIWMKLLVGIGNFNYLMMLCLCLAGCFFVAFGVYIQVKAKAVMLPGDGLVKVISSKLIKEFGKIKILFDSSLVGISIIISLIVKHRLLGVREGTIIAAFLVGSIIRFLTKRVHIFDINT